MIDLGSDEDMQSSEDNRPESVGRALMSDEDSGDVVEMTEFSTRRTQDSGQRDTEQEADVNTPLAGGDRDSLD